MARVRIEYVSPASGGLANPLGGALVSAVAEFSVTGSATVAGSRPVVPTPSHSPIYAVIFALDGPVYAATGSDPTASDTAGVRVEPGTPRTLAVSPGDKLSFITAPDTASSAIIGKVGIDQTTPGVTNGVVVSGAQVTTATATIANAASLSGAVDCSGGRVCGILIPAAWTTANLTFQGSMDNATFADLYDSSGTEYTVTVGGVSRYIEVPLADFIGIRYLKVRSGTTGTPVAQGGSRTLTLALLP